MRVFYILALNLPTGKIIKKQLVKIDFALKFLEFKPPEFRGVRTGQRVPTDFLAGVKKDVN